MGTIQALGECSYGSWYRRYSQLAFDSRVIDLEAGFVQFLHEEGLVLHEHSEAVPRRLKPTEVVVEGVDYDPDDLYSDSSSSSDSHDSASGSDTGSDSSGPHQAPWTERFAGVHAAIAAAIHQLGGLVAPRLNWSSPTDALWLSTDNSLRCRNPDEVILLLKSSDRVGHDLDQLQELETTQQQQQKDYPETDQHQQAQQHLQEGCTALASSLQQQHHMQHEPQAATSSSPSTPTTLLQPQLVLRKWANLPPEREFRCFVYEHKLVGISQRNVSQHFPQLTQQHEQQQEEGGGQNGILSGIQAQLVEFHSRYIAASFPLSAYAMDAYVPPHGPVKLLDFNPISSTTSPLLFSWEELPYQNMKQQQQQQHERDHDCEQQQQQQHKQQPVQQAPPRHDQPTADGVQQQEQMPHSNRSSSSSVELRVVQHEGMIMPGCRAVTGMPVDMLGLQDAFGHVMQRMQEQQQQQLK